MILEGVHCWCDAEFHVVTDLSLILRPLIIATKKGLTTRGCSPSLQNIYKCGRLELNQHHLLR